MGNDQSTSNEFSIDDDDEAILTTDKWTLKMAYSPYGEKDLVAFVGNLGFLEKLSQKMKCYRHPNILRFIRCHKENPNKFVIYTEYAVPLSSSIPNQSSFQINLGLYDIIKAIEFLHSRGKVCLNKSIDMNESIFVTRDGRWKLVGLEEVVGVTKERLNTDLKNLGEFIISLGIRNDDLNNYVQESLICNEASSVSELQNRPYFTDCDLIYIVEYLTDLPLKVEKEEFFSSLTQKLFEIDEDLISKHLIGLLLSRYVVMDPSAKHYFIPNILTPYIGDRRPNYDPLSVKNPILNVDLFRENVVPKLIDIFQVHELGIRTVLLNNFSNYVSSFSTLVLERDILPQLLLGMKDENDELVANTLRALADCIPILGSSKVVGMKKSRRKIFLDGTPNKMITTSSTQQSEEIINKQSILNLPRHSPIGAETEEDEDWNVKWGDDEKEDSQSIIIEEQSIQPSSPSFDSINLSPIKNSNSTSKYAIKLNDIDSYDIKSINFKSMTTSQNAFDYFADMTPNIEKTKPVPLKTKFDIVENDNETTGASGWDDEEPWDDF